MNPAPSRQMPLPAAISIPVQALVFSGPSCFLDPDGDGSTVCYLDPGQLSSYPGGRCHTDPDGDGHLVCHFRNR